MSWWSIVLLVGFSQGVFLIIALLTSRKPSIIANRYLTLLIFAVVINIGFQLSVSYNVHYIFHISLRILSIATPLLIGPSLLLYFKETITSQNNNRKVNGLHFLPFLLLTIFLIILEILTNSVSNNNIWYVTVIELLKLIHISAYFILSFNLLNHFSNKKGKVLFKDNSKAVFLYFRSLLMIFTLSLLLSLLIFVGVKYFSIAMLAEASVFTSIILVIIIYLIAFVALRFPITVYHDKDNIIVKNSQKYRTSSLTKEEIKRLKELILKFMIDEKPFLDEKLKIDDLAAALQIPSHNLSQIINQEFSKSFKDFINHYRIEEFKKKVSDPKEQHKTILGLAYESGFSSKASFNRIFKTFTSITPKEFRDQNLNNK